MIVKKSKRIFPAVIILVFLLSYALFDIISFANIHTRIFTESSNDMDTLYNICVQNSILTVSPRNVLTEDKDVYYVKYEKWYFISTERLNDRELEQVAKIMDRLKDYRVESLSFAPATRTFDLILNSDIFTLYIVGYSMIFYFENPKAKEDEISLWKKKSSIQNITEIKEHWYRFNII